MAFFLPMNVICLNATTINKLYFAISAYQKNNPFINSIIFEIRIDLMARIEYLELSKLICKYRNNILITIKSNDLILVNKIAKFKPKFMDIDLDFLTDDILDIIRVNSEVEFILSYHNFSAVPKDFRNIIKKMTRFKCFTM